MPEAKRKGIPTGKAWQFMKRVEKERTLRGLLIPVLDGECAALCMDDENDRAYLLSAVVAALLGDP